MHCASCSILIDMELENIEGVNSSYTSYVKQETEVEFDPKKVTDNLIIETIKKTGYTAKVS